MGLSISSGALYLSGGIIGMCLFFFFGFFFLLIVLIFRVALCVGQAAED